MSAHYPRRHPAAHRLRPETVCTLRAVCRLAALVDPTGERLSPGSRCPRETVDAVLARVLEPELTRLTELATQAGLDPAGILADEPVRRLRRGEVPSRGWNFGPIVVD